MEVPSRPILTHGVPLKLENGQKGLVVGVEWKVTHMKFTHVFLYHVFKALIDSGLQSVPQGAKELCLRPYLCTVV